MSGYVYYFTTEGLVIMMNRRSIFGLTTLFVVCLAVTAVNAETILVGPGVNNGSWESPVVPGSTPGVSTGAVLVPTGWGGLGVYLQTVGVTTGNVWNVTATDGNQMAALVGYVGNGYAGLTLPDLFQADTIYNLDMDASVGTVNTPATATATVSLTDVGGVYRLDVPVTSSAYATGPAPYTVTWAPIPTIVLNTALNPEFVGLAINLGVHNPRTDAQFWVDNIRLTATAVPEPATLVLLATGVMGMLICAYRRRK